MAAFPLFDQLHSATFHIKNVCRSTFTYLGICTFIIAVLALLIQYTDNNYPFWCPESDSDRHFTGLKPDAILPIGLPEQNKNPCAIRAGEQILYVYSSSYPASFNQSDEKLYRHKFLISGTKISKILLFAKNIIKLADIFIKMIL